MKFLNFDVGMVLFVIGSVALGVLICFWLPKPNHSLANEYGEDTVSISDLAIDDFFHPNLPVRSLPSNLSSFGQLTTQGEGADREVTLGPMDEDRCQTLWALLNRPNHQAQVQVKLYDATLETWTFRYREASNHYRNDGPHGSYEPQPCQVVNDSQRLFHFSALPEPQPTT